MGRSVEQEVSMYRSYSRLFRATFLATAVVALLPAFSAEADAQTRGGNVVFARPEDPLTLNPFGPSDNGSIYAIEQICDSLVEADATGKGLRPGLAESWEASEDRLTYTFKLRDAKFSNGEPVTVDDVVFSLQQAARPEATYGFAFEPVESITAGAEPMTVVVKLKSPYTALPSALSLFSAAVVSKAAFEANPEAFGANPVCAGPFKVESYERGNELVLVPNEHYWEKAADGQPLPLLDRVTLRYVPESNSRVLGLQNGDYDIIGTVPFNQATAIEALDNITLEVAPIYRLDYVYLNHGAEPIDDENIRLAMNHAANREAILQAVYFGYGEIPNSYMPKINFWSEAVAPIPFDLEKAKELVQAAGYDGTPIQLMVDTGNAPSRQIATILQQGWQQAGLNVEIVEYDVGTAFGMTEKGEYQAYVSYITSDINDDDELANLQLDYRGATRAFFSEYKNDEVLGHLKQARESADPAVRAELYGRIQDIAYNDGYSVPLNFVPSVNAYQNHVKGFRTLTTGWWWLKDVSVEQ
jgi:peptide/nickel transport system substrate-binding protein